jgi:hypothetical protein
MQKKDPLGAQAGRIVSTSGIEQMPSYTQKTRIVNTPTPSGYPLFKHNPNIIGRPKPPKRELVYPDRWVTLGIPALKVLARLARDAVKT